MGKVVLVTGANGFIGQAVLRFVTGAGWHAVAAVRNFSYPIVDPAIAWTTIGDICLDPDWAPLLEGVDCVVHLAARAHVLQESVPDPWAQYRNVNTDATLRLAQAAATAGVKRFVYVSSIGVNGNKTGLTPFTEKDTPTPLEDYARSKWEAERGLHSLAAKSALETVVLRPPLVYGPRAPGNFPRLANWVVKGVPLPLASVNNARSFVFVENLADAIGRCLQHENARNRTFLVRDGMDISTPGFIRLIAGSADVRPRLLPCPPTVLRTIGGMLGYSRALGSLLDSLQIDDSAIRTCLNWQPPYTMEQGMAITMQAFRGKAAEAEGS